MPLRRRAKALVEEFTMNVVYGVGPSNTYRISGNRLGTTSASLRFAKNVRHTEALG